MINHIIASVINGTMTEDTLEEVEHFLRSTDRKVASQQAQHLYPFSLLVALVSHRGVPNGRGQGTVLTVLLSILSLLALGWTRQIPPISTGKGIPCRNNLESPVILASEEGVLRYACPCSPTTANGVATNNPAEGEPYRWYSENSKRIVANMSNYLEVFRKLTFDNWGHTYEEVKIATREWKSKHFIQLHDNMSIYESACGIGLNLFMTLEILQEVKQVRNLVVYGNEFVPESVVIARAMAGQLPAGGRLGTICAGDSTALPYVPSSSFDLVFSGYITPLLDPLGLNKSSTENFGDYEALCRATDAASVRSRDLYQERQNAWYAKWFGEMVRIAKPGAPVIAEQVSYPLCNATWDWGGVAPDFWPTAIRKYGWDVDPTSLVTENDRIFSKRYHVFVRKRQAH